ncbi:MAG: hypothetical protein ACK5KM_03795, partial [Hyphomicrobiaceae bacterium]
KIEVDVADHSSATAKTDAEEIGANSSPGPSGFQAVASQCVGRFARSAASRCIALLLAQLTA